jgi:hypothetical protein
MYSVISLVQRQNVQKTVNITNAKYKEIYSWLVIEFQIRKSELR